MLGFVKRTSSDFKLFNLLKTLNFVRSHLEYDAVVWSPSTIDNQYKVKCVQPSPD